MMKAIAKSCPGHKIKSQQRDEPDLTDEEKEIELEKIFDTNPVNFLRKFRAHLRREHLLEIRTRLIADFSGENANQDYEIEYLLNEILEEMDDKKKKTKIKNRRFSAMKSLGKDDFFSPTEMRRRNPLLHSDLVESNLTDEEVSARRSKETEEEKRREDEARQKDLEERIKERELLKRAEKEEMGLIDDDDEGIRVEPATSEHSNGSSRFPLAPSGMSSRLDMNSISHSLPSTSSPAIDTTTLSEYLLKCYDEKETNKFRDFQKGGEEEVEEEEDDDEEEDEERGAEDSAEKPRKEVSEAKKSLLEAEFESRMREQFLDGGDAIFGVDYQRIDEDEKLDDLETIDRDAEEKWFEDDDEDDIVEDALDKMDEDQLNCRGNGRTVGDPKADDDEVDYLDFALE